jgi:hypothetical protein
MAMNVFAVDPDPVVAAQALHDAHVVKMTLETAQILCTVIHKYSPNPPAGLYKPTHPNHPCVRWAGDYQENYDWLLAHGNALSAEYSFRFVRRHKTQDIYDILNRFNPGLPDFQLQPFVQAMPTLFRGEDPIKAYRGYYGMEKRQGNRWSRRNPPSWLAGFPPSSKL